MNPRPVSARKFAVMAGGRAELLYGEEESSRQGASHLKMVPMQDRLLAVQPIHYEPAPHCQLRLPLIEPASLVVVEMNDLRSRHEFCWLFRYVKPRAVFDLRIRPGFYIDVNLDHSGVFRLFEDVSTEYFDLVTGLLGIDDKDHPRLKPPSLGAAISTQLAALAKPCFPIVLLAARRETAQEFLSALPRYLFPKPPGGWNGILHRDLLDRAQSRRSSATVSEH